MKRTFAAAAVALSVVPALFIAWTEPAALACRDGAQAPCRINGRPGIRECVNGRWSPCLANDPSPTPPPPPTPTPSPTPPPPSLAAAPAHEVRVESNPEQVDRRTTFSDCCVTCEEQTLEAVTPRPTGPRAHLDSEPPPLRRTFCGTVAAYGVNDEVADPRDITINLTPLPIAPFPDFVAGIINTPATRLKGADKQAFGRVLCDANACVQQAALVEGKVIHAEITPDEHFYGQDARFLPIDDHGPCGDGDAGCISELEPERGADDVCVHGVYAIDHGEHSAAFHRRLCCAPDGSHDHPEIHPFDAIWWRHPGKDGWMLGVFQDDSNRYSRPHCGDTNGNRWSDAPRDVTFRFPFRFSAASGCRRVQLRHVRTTSLRTGAGHTVVPLNVTTAEFAGGAQDVLILAAPGPRFRPLLEVVKEPDSGRETHVVVQGGASGGFVAGEIVLRVTVGTHRRSGLLFDELQELNPLAIYDTGDPGAGYYYAELFFEGSCDPVIER